MSKRSRRQRNGAGAAADGNGAGAGTAPPPHHQGAANGGGGAPHHNNHPHPRPLSDPHVAQLYEEWRDMYRRDGHRAEVVFGPDVTPTQAAAWLVEKLVDGPPGTPQPWSPRWLRGGSKGWCLRDAIALFAMVAPIVSALLSALAAVALLSHAGANASLVHLAAAVCAAFAAYRAFWATCMFAHAQDGALTGEAPVEAALASAKAAEHLQATALLAAGANTVLTYSARRAASAALAAALLAAEAAAERAAAAGGGAEQAAAAAAASAVEREVVAVAAAGGAGGGLAAAERWAHWALTYSTVAAAAAALPAALFVSMGSGHTSRAYAAALFCAFAGGAALSGGGGVSAGGGAGAAALAVALASAARLDGWLGELWRPARPEPTRYTYRYG
jgi:hypothetical protein